MSGLRIIVSDTLSPGLYALTSILYALSESSTFCGMRASVTGLFDIYSCVGSGPDLGETAQQSTPAFQNNSWKHFNEFA